MTQENHSEWGRTKSARPMAVNLVDGRLWTRGWSRGANAVLPLIVPWGTFNQEAAAFVMEEEGARFLPLHHDSNTRQRSVYSDDVGNSDERPYIILWCDVISLLVIFLNVCQKDMRS